MASFGQELKRERELRDISLKEISEATKISIRFLEALEQDNYDILPGGIFNRGFIRAYARFIGVDGEELVNAYVHEVSQREARPGAPADGKPAPASAPAAHAPATQMFRPDNRPAPRPDREAKGREIPAERKSMVPLGGGSRPERVERHSPALLWGAGGLVLVIGAAVLTMSLLNERRADSSGDSVAQARLARATRKAGTPGSEPPVAIIQEIASAHGVQPGDPDGAASQAPGTPEPGPTEGTADSGATPSSPDSTPPEPAPIEHIIRIQATEVTRVRLECSGRMTIDQELWPGQARTVTCAEPVVLGADNAGAIQYALDSGAVALLGSIGERIEAAQVAPVAAPEPEPSSPAPRREPPPAVPDAPPRASDGRR